MYFKSVYHQETAEQLMQQFGFQSLEDDRDYGAFCYLATATYKYDDLKKVVGEEGIDLDTLEQRLLVYSPTEMGMIRFALQLFNPEIDDIKLGDFLLSCDEENKMVVLEAIRFRFYVTEPYRQID